MKKLRNLLAAAVSWWRDFKPVARAFLKRPSTLSVIIATLTSCMPALAHADLWNGTLCNAANQILDNELYTTVSLGSAAGMIIAWMLDDGKSAIKLNALRIGAGTLTLLNLPVVYGAITNHAYACG